jgi:hypothetical protein
MSGKIEDWSEEEWAAAKAIQETKINGQRNRISDEYALLMARNALSAAVALSSVTPSDSVPEGYVLVPIELTDEMDRAAWWAAYKFHGATDEEARILTERRITDPEQREHTRVSWKAALAAAPPPPAPHISKEG